MLFWLLQNLASIEEFSFFWEKVQVYCQLQVAVTFFNSND